MKRIIGYSWFGSILAVGGFYAFKSDPEGKIIENLETSQVETKKVEGSGTKSQVSLFHSNKKQEDNKVLRNEYVNRYCKVAQDEQAQFGIPASITLAQGILESASGTSTLAEKNNNHFGVKCFKRNCPKGHCTNHTDDSHKDFFRKYESPWQSFREHSLLLNSNHYKPLHKYKDYKKWATGLKVLGYATDKNYAESLIEIIEEYDLTRFDK
jgi:flagellum-specific peptidoglycan hydrolase FlgJ